jgi:hypothetical protein
MYCSVQNLFVAGDAKQMKFGGGVSDDFLK